ncbi:MAG: C39 family peptidase [bacterium]
MKRLTRLVAFALVAVNLFNMVIVWKPPAVFAETSEIPEVSSDTQDQSQFRNEQQQTIQTGVNQYQLTASVDKKYFDNNGNWQEIKTNFLDTVQGDFPIIASNGDFTIKASRDLRNGVKFIKSNAEIIFKPETTNPDVQLLFNDNTLIYQEIFPEVDWQIVLFNDGFTNELIIKSTNGIQAAYPFTITSSDPATSIVSNENMLEIWQQEQLIWKTDPAVVYDSISASSAVDMIELEQNSVEKTEEKLIASASGLINNFQKQIQIGAESFLQDPQRKYPIHLDPSFSSGVYSDTFVSPSTINPANGSRRFMPIGTYTDYTITGYPVFSQSRALLYFGQLAIPANAQFSSAELDLHYYGTNTSNGDVYAALVTDGWDESTTWNNQPSYTGNYGQAKFSVFNSSSRSLLKQMVLATDIVPFLQVPNNGILLRNANESAPGTVICSRNIPSGPCANGDEPTLIINYTVNQPPIPTNLDYPDDLSEYSAQKNSAIVNCDSTGLGLGCDLEFRFQAVDPDSTQPVTTDIEITRSNGLQIKKTIVGNEWQVFRQAIKDGQWTWRAISRDSNNLYGDWSVTKTFMVDTTPPPIPELILEPKYVSGDSNTIIANPVVDNLKGEVKYNFQIGKTSDFTSILNQSGWITQPQFTFPNLLNNQEYFYRVQAKDNLDNASKFSNVTSSIQDTISPVINNLQLSNDVIANLVVDNYLDQSILHMEVTEDFFQETQIAIIDVNNQIVRSYPVTEKISNVVIDGRDASNQILIDGIYQIQISVKDLAGNETQDNSLRIRIDNNPPEINISDPVTGSWFHTEQMTINGITEANAELQVQNITTDENGTIMINPFTGIFSAEIPLVIGKNEIIIQAIDANHNAFTKTLELFRENTAPVINVLLPQLQSKVADFQIALQLSDLGDEVNGENFISGLDLSQLKISLQRVSGEELILVDQGEDIAKIGDFQINCRSINQCEVNYNFFQKLQPDDDYILVVKNADLAGNISNENTNFTLDSNAFLQVTAPVTNEIFNHSLILIQGTAEAGSIMNITGKADQVSFIIDPEIINDQFSVTNCRNLPLAITLLQSTVCDFQVNDFQLIADAVTNQYLEELLQIETTDTFGNIAKQELPMKVNLFAVNLKISNDLEYFSPNGDGRQDGINFYDIASDGLIDNWGLIILDANQQIIREFQGTGSLPASLYWDGKIIGLNNDYQYLPDGQYQYYLKIITTDQVTIQTNPEAIYAKTKLDAEVVITSPKNDSIITNGLINVQGQAPLNTLVEICLHFVGSNVACNMEFESKVDENSSFSHLLPLPRKSNMINEFYITAKAKDEYGNFTPVSNQVHLTLDTIAPFSGIAILPAYSGVNKASDYQKILDKLAKNEVITETDIKSLRNVIFRSQVSKNTEAVTFQFREQTNLSELDPAIAFQDIGYISGDNETHLFAAVKDNQEQSCLDDLCTWDFYYPVPPVNGGIYEIGFTAKKADLTATMSAPLILDGTLPAAPMILDINKIVEQQSRNLNYWEKTYYSNSKQIEVTGVADPRQQIFIQNQSGQQLCQTTTDEIGLFSCQIDLEALYPVVKDLALQLKVIASDGLNQTESLESTNLVVDQTIPQITEFSAARLWYQSGNLADFTLQANEKLIRAVISDQENRKVLVNLNESKLKGTAGAIIPGLSAEGRWLEKVTIFDLAENSNMADMTLYLDNTAPLSSELHLKDGSEVIDWGTKNGKEAMSDLPAAGRLQPEFIIRGDLLLLHGVAEKNSHVRLAVNSQIITDVAVNSNQCQFISEREIIKNEVAVREGDSCEWNYNFSLNKEQGYVISYDIHDQAGNISERSQDQIIYYDKTKPLLPILDRVTNANGTVLTKLGNNNESVSITRELEAKYTGYAESLADLDFTVKSPQGNLSNTLQINSGKGDFIKNLGLGTKPDQGDCIEVNGLKRSGRCEDGIYEINTLAYDAPGNASDSYSFKIIRDTVAPQVPLIDNIYLCGQNICLNVKGEAEAKLVINGQKSFSLQESSQSFIIKSNWNSDQTYQFSLAAEDLAGNRSETIVKEIQTPKTLGTGDRDNYSQLNDDNFSNVMMDVTIDRVTADYYIEHYEIPVPLLTASYTSPGNIAEIYGVALAEYHFGDAKISMKFLSYQQAMSKCHANIVTIIFDKNEQECVATETGFRTYGEGQNILQNLCAGEGLFDKQICINYQKESFREEHFVANQLFKIPHVMVSLENASWSNYVASLWNSDQSGRFKFEIPLTERIHLYDMVWTRATIFGEFDYQGYQINYRGRSRTEAEKNSGLTSDYSNSIQVDVSTWANLEGERAKIIAAPYFNQWLEPDNSKFPKDGWMMCGAASAVIVAGYYNKLNYNLSDQHDLKKFMYSDSGQGISGTKCGSDKGGAFEYTNYGCNQSYLGGIQNYLAHFGLNSRKISSFDDIVYSIDHGNPVIYSYGQYGDSNFGHIATIVGYTEDKQNIVVQDTYTNTVKFGRKWSGYNDGKFSVYPFSSSKFYIKYLLTVNN